MALSGESNKKWLGGSQNKRQSQELAACNKSTIEYEDLKIWGCKSKRVFENKGERL
jgi:ribosomal protein L37AE/L43A